MKRLTACFSKVVNPYNNNDKKDLNASYQKEKKKERKEKKKERKKEKLMRTSCHVTVLGHTVAGGVP